jgi:predicted Ser/Thr protein kinase
MIKIISREEMDEGKERNKSIPVGKRTKHYNCYWNQKLRTFVCYEYNHGWEYLKVRKTDDPYTAITMLNRKTKLEAL